MFLCLDYEMQRAVMVELVVISVVLMSDYEMQRAVVVPRSGVLEVKLFLI